MGVERRTARGGEFARLQQVTEVCWARTPDALTGADLVVLPGSKHVPNDLAWARSCGMADAVISAAASGVPVLGICGGLQMLGGAIEDPAGVEGSAEGLDLLPVATSYLPGKTTQRTAVRFGRLPPAWSWVGLDPGLVYPLQLGCVVLGAFGSAAVAHRIAGEFHPARTVRAALPWTVLIVLLATASAWILSLPMEMRSVGLQG